jgi:hypothetical protein
MGKNTKQTSPKVATKASKDLRKPSSSKDQKSVDASAVSQAPGKNKKK